MAIGINMNALKTALKAGVTATLLVVLFSMIDFGLS